MSGLIGFEAIKLAFARPVFTAPTFSLSTAIGVRDSAVHRHHVLAKRSRDRRAARQRLQTPVSPLIGWTGLTELLLAPFGGFSFNLAAITAAICA